MNAPSAEQDLDRIVSRVDFYESCVDQLRKELPKYMSKHAELGKNHKSVAKVFRAVASSEPNQKLQSIMFLYAQRQEMVEKERSVFESSQIQNQEQMEECKKLIIYPLREILNEHLTLRKKTLALKAKEGSAAVPPKSNDDIDDSQYTRSTLPLHTKMFEKHRVQSLRKVMTRMVHTELQFHCKAVEELSNVYDALSRFNDEEAH